MTGEEFTSAQVKMKVTLRRKVSLSREKRYYEVVLVVFLAAVVVVVIIDIVINVRVVIVVRKFLLSANVRSVVASDNLTTTLRLFRAIAFTNIFLNIYQR
ncbi:Hypothetical predicted protein [Octopus vulgaris]|uniref:Uncharacterized protein n=1 Tax=Octopus vulgaris TaxID=6645 RepID=A0AA36F0C5_OCTVU|nr:Hypothetical predicted protein [Octopus vulgaris]